MSGPNRTDNTISPLRNTIYGDLFDDMMYGLWGVRDTGQSLTYEPYYKSVHDLAGTVNDNIETEISTAYAFDPEKG